MPFCRNCGSSLPCTCACSTQTIRIIHDDVDIRKVESLMRDAEIAEKQNRLGTAIKYYSDVIEEIGNDRKYESIKKEAELAITNINMTKNMSDQAVASCNRGNYEEALSLINNALSYSQNNSHDWNEKAYILERLKRFFESESCYEKALKLNESKIIKNNEAMMLSDWAYDLDKMGNYIYALEKINKALPLFNTNEEYEIAMKRKINILGNYNTYLQEVKNFKMAEDIRHELTDIMTQIVLEDETINGKIPSNMTGEERIDEIINIYAKKGYEYYEKTFCREYGFALYIKGTICEKEKKYLKAMFYYVNSFHVYYLYFKPFKDFENILKNVDFETLNDEIKDLKIDNDEEKRDKVKMIYKLAFAIANGEIYEKIPLAIHLANTVIGLVPKTDHEMTDKFNRLIGFSKERMEFFRKNRETIECIESSDKKDLITITGNQFQSPELEFKKGMIFRLIREPQNQYDPEAIAVYYNDEKICYVANSDNTASDLTSKAHDIQDIGENTCAEYLMVYGGYHIAKIINDMDNINK